MGAFDNVRRGPSHVPRVHGRHANLHASVIVRNVSIARRPCLRADIAPRDGRRVIGAKRSLEIWVKIMATGLPTNNGDRHDQTEYAYDITARATHAMLLARHHARRARTRRWCCGMRTPTRRRPTPKQRSFGRRERSPVAGRRLVIGRLLRTLRGMLSWFCLQASDIAIVLAEALRNFPLVKTPPVLD